MDKLIQDLQKTILALEKLSGSSSSASDKIDELLDQLFQQKIDLVNASPNAGSNYYKQAAQAVAQAAAKSERAVKDHTVIPEMIKVVNDAIAKLARVLDYLVPLE